MHRKWSGEMSTELVEAEQQKMSRFLSGWKLLPDSKLDPMKH